MITNSLNPYKVEWLARVLSARREAQLTPSCNNSIKPKRIFMKVNVEDFRHTAF